MPDATARSTTSTSSTASSLIATVDFTGASAGVFHGIVDGLEHGTFVPGQRLVEADLASAFDVGRNSVREALQRLAADGIVDLSRHRGAAIRKLTLQDTLDVLDVAERMTALLMRCATRGRADRVLVRRLQEAMKALRAEKAPEPFASARRAFYRVLLDMSDNRELRRLFPAIQMPIVHAQHRLPGLRSLRLVDYARMAAAALSGDAEAAEEAGAAHVRHVRERVLATASGRG